MTNCPACGAPLGNSTTNCPFCNYSLIQQPSKTATDELYNPPIEREPEPSYEMPDENDVPIAIDPEPEPAYTPPPSTPDPIAELADSGRQIRKTGGKIAIGIVIAVVAACLLCVGAVILGSVALANGWFG